MVTKKTQKAKQLSEKELQDLVIDSDTGARKPRGVIAPSILWGTALIWALFQLWIASPLPYSDFVVNTLGIPIINQNKARFFHLAFAVFLAFLAYPAFKRSPRNYIPYLDWGLAIIGACTSLYLFVFFDELARRTGMPITQDIVIALVGLAILLEAARRALGPPLVVIACIFLFYTVAGNWSIMPDVIAHKGQSLAKITSHMWSDEGVFGIAISVSTSFIFLFVLFGSLLDKAGAGNYFIKLAFSLLGHLRGGPAKAAVLASGMTGLVSGSSIANVVTTGTFTVPLMRRVGFSREKAGAVEVASSVNGQIMPPVMGAAAFLMVEYVGISYVEVVKHAFLPALISYIALVYLVHLEALKSNMEVIPKSVNTTFIQKIITFTLVVSSFILFSAAVYYGVGWIKPLAGDNSIYVIGAAILAVYIALLKFASKYPPLERDNPNSPIITLPEAGPTAKTGLHFLLPIFILVWCLMVERLSPGMSAFWATMSMVIILITQHPIIAFFRKEETPWVDNLKTGAVELLDGLITGARNMVGIAIATASAGIIVGAVSLTGVGQVMTELVEVISGGSFILVLVFTAFICLILGMGLPTTANYIVVASLMAKVIEDLGAQNGIIVPAIAVHLFVFYFGIMADVTPPVGLASFAAAAVSGGDPIRTGIQAFVYSMRTVILPFIFIYNTELLLIGVDSWWMVLLIAIKSVVAILIFAAATQGYFIVRSKLYESIILLLVAFTLFRPGFWVNVIQSPYERQSAEHIERIVDSATAGQAIKLIMEHTKRSGDIASYAAFINIGADNMTPIERLEKFGVVLEKEGRQWIVTDVVFNSEAEAAGIDFDDVVKEVFVPQQQMDKAWFYIPAVLLLMFVVLSQRTRRRYAQAIETDNIVKQGA